MPEHHAVTAVRVQARAMSSRPRGMNTEKISLHTWRLHAEFAVRLAAAAC